MMPLFGTSGFLFAIDGTIAFVAWMSLDLDDSCVWKVILTGLMICFGYLGASDLWETLPWAMPWYMVFPIRGFIWRLIILVTFGGVMFMHRHHGRTK